MAIQMAATIRVRESIAAIMAVQIPAPSIGTSGNFLEDSGDLNGLSIFGDLIRRIHIPRLTSTNANNVPKLVRSPAVCPGTNAANNPTNTNKIQLALYGV